jgi:hypothetical protein
MDTRGERDWMSSAAWMACVKRTAALMKPKHMMKLQRPRLGIM